MLCNELGVSCSDSSLRIYPVEQPENKCYNQQICPRNSLPSWGRVNLQLSEHLYPGWVEPVPLVILTKYAFQERTKSSLNNDEMEKPD